PPSFKEEFLPLKSKPPELEEIQMPYILKFAPSSKNEVFQRSRKGIHKDKVDEVVPNFLNEFSTLGNSIKKYLEKREHIRTVFDPGGQDMFIVGCT
ncbi:hypothetical protein DVA67_035570, partial [Solirubrobacter sp. CPCC 204708]|nr:hypothetical protein [Solirubrobacter deserti]